MFQPKVNGPQVEINHYEVDADFDYNNKLLVNECGYKIKDPNRYRDICRINGKWNKLWKAMDQLDKALEVLDEALE